ncbi:hypothetical protein TNCV_4623041 [Trichonephila clavipes]|nr:hypothetical protein TNCV_4623041 [Trichonephila clavipes]
MPTCCKDCSRLLFRPTHATSSLACLFVGCVAYWGRIRVGFGWSASRSCPVPCSFKKRTFATHTSTMNSLPQADNQNLFDSMPRRIVTLIAACGGYTKY